MGGSGAGRATTRHELNAVPHHVGHGERVLVIGEPPVAGCRCCSSHRHSPPGRTTSTATINKITTSTVITTNPITTIATSPVIFRNKRHHVGNDWSTDHVNLPSPPPLTLLHIHDSNNANAIVNGNAKAAMSSPPKHRRGFDPNDATANDYRRYRRVKTRQRGFVCDPHIRVTLWTNFWTHRIFPKNPTYPAQHPPHTRLRCLMLDRFLVASCSPARV
ncbi:uncharacterized protein LOC107267992 [Cephus cinctus]|uniref:Uncharacterized protein LOC107267992 n=1 Tax=Cephus cinctus TaxID=211228 RepID=A0AAJ7BX62_CEPCN|nr:uncharacterized protein LOC107267992 [Cephus cinctus]